MKKKNITITKIWDIDCPYYERVEDFLERIKTSCKIVKNDFPIFLNYKFHFDVTNDYDFYGDQISKCKITMKATRQETDDEAKKRISKENYQKMKSKIKELEKELFGE